VQPPRRYRLRELARLVGVEPRTIRSYIQQAVIPGPDQRGRNARYGPVHLDRLRAVAYLRNQRGLSLPAIRALLPSLSEAKIREIPSGYLVVDPPFAGSGAIPLMVAALTTQSGRIAEGAAGYGDSVRTRRRRRVERPSSSRSRTLATAFDGLLGHLQPAVHAQSVPRVARGELWVRIAITPDVELNVRNVAGAEALGALVRIADHVRYMLLHPLRSGPRT
jgi:DNA-binding transcriptional MerR regulator